MKVARGGETPDEWSSESGDDEGVFLYCIRFVGRPETVKNNLLSGYRRERAAERLQLRYWLATSDVNCSLGSGDSEKVISYRQIVIVAEKSWRQTVMESTVMSLKTMIKRRRV